MREAAQHLAHNVGDELHESQITIIVKFYDDKLIEDFYHYGSANASATTRKSLNLGKDFPTQEMDGKFFNDDSKMKLSSIAMPSPSS